MPCTFFVQAQTKTPATLGGEQKKSINLKYDCRQNVSENTIRNIDGAKVLLFFDIAKLLLIFLYFYV